MFSITIPSKPIFDKAVSDILSKPGYKHLTGGLFDFVKSIQEKIREWLSGVLERTFSNLENVPKISDRLSTVFMIIGIIIILAIIIFIIVRVNKTFDKKARVKEILGEKIHEGVTPDSLRSIGAEYTQKGDFRQAIRYDFIAVLLLMHERNIVYLDEAKTGEEIYSYLRKNRFQSMDVFKKLVNIFNASWYGHKRSDQKLYDEWSSTLSFIWNGVKDNEEKRQ